MNDVDVLVDMWKPGTVEPLRICYAGACWEEANGRGYLSNSQIKAARDQSSNQLSDDRP